MAAKAHTGRLRLNRAGSGGPGRGRRLRSTLVVALAGALTLAMPAPPAVADAEYVVKAAFIERFTRFAEWPAASSVGDRREPFTLCVAGRNPFDTALDKLAGITPIKGKSAVVRYQVEPRRIRGCELLFISRSESARLSEYLRAAHGLPILTVGDTPGFAERGVMINFFEQGNRLRFEINNPVARAAGLTLNSRLLGVARLVPETAP